MSKAKAYAIGEQKYLIEYLNNPLVPISNNSAENAIRPFVVGRKQWLFSNTVKGAKASAVFYSIAATVCANGLNVERYFTYLFRTLPHTKEIDENVLPLSEKMIEKFQLDFFDYIDYILFSHKMEIISIRYFIYAYYNRVYYDDQEYIFGMIKKYTDKKYGVQTLGLLV